jgi:hypothetical protein
MQRRLHLERWWIDPERWRSGSTLSDGASTLRGAGCGSTPSNVDRGHVRAAAVGLLSPPSDDGGGVVQP